MARIVSELIYKLIADETELVKGLQKAEKSTDALAKKFTDSGKKLTLGLTVPIVAAGAAMIKLASETEDSINAVNVVFKDGADAVLAYGDIAFETAGLSKTAFNDVANSFGVLLSMTTDNMDTVAADTITLTQRAADLASLLGGSTKDAAVALGAALRGETEPARRYGVILSEATVQAKALELGIGGVNGELTEAEKVQVRYNLILEQSARAQGDFANTNDDTKNSAQVLRAQISNLTAELGEQLLPIIVEVLSSLRGLMSGFSDLTDEQKRAILIIAGVAAAIGPMLIGVGQAVTAINTLKTAFTALSVAGGGPVALAIAGIAAVTVGVLAFADNVKKAQEEYSKLQTVMAGGSTGSIANDLKLVNKELETVKAQLFASTGFSEKETQELEKQIEQLNIVKNSLADKARSQGLNARAQAEIAKSAAEEAKQELQTEESQKRRAEIIERYKRNRQLVVDILNSEKTEYEKIQEQIDILQNSPWASGQNEKDRLDALDVLRAKQIEVVEAERVDEQNRSEETQNDLISRKEQYLNALQEMSTAELELYTLTTNEANRASIEKILSERKIEEERIKNADKEKQRIDLLRNLNTSAVNSLLSGFSDVGSALVEGENGWRVYGKAGLNAVASMLDALGAFMAAQAAAGLAAAFFSFGASTVPVPIALAGSAAAYTSAGVIRALAGNLAEGGSFIVPNGYPNDSFPIPAAMVQSGERVTVETPEQQSSNRGITLQVGVLVADEAGLRELDSRLRDIGSFETARRG